MDFISGQLTNPIHMIPFQFVNIPKILFGDRDLLMLLYIVAQYNDNMISFFGGSNIYVSNLFSHD